MSVIRIGTRESKLAMIQAQTVAAAIETFDSSLKTQLVPMKTTGDIILDRTLDKIGGKGLFVKELDRALLDGEVDIVVHSCKDLPVELNEELPLVAVSKREDPRDVFVLPQATDIFDQAIPIGCSSARRRIQLADLFPEASVKSVRGNVITRLEKLDRGEYGALTLAAAGLKRLDLGDRISRIFTIDEMIPSAGQGILAIQSRVGINTDYLACIHDETVEVCVRAERAFIRALDGGCSSPCAAHAVIENDKVVLRGMYVNEDETIVVRETQTFEMENSEVQAADMALRMKEGATHE